jgi:2-dehydro-3-deoxyphosphogluconate aldolase/(4S)-4-hydroxy-2-oxoglutarate aldolase
VPAGGVGMLNGIAVPLSDVSFCPTGGITQETAPQFLACKNVVRGRLLADPKAAIEAGDWDKITEIAKAASCAEEGLSHSTAAAKKGGTNRYRPFS